MSKKTAKKKVSKKKASKKKASRKTQTKKKAAKDGTARGRNVINIDMTQLQKLCEFQCTAEECAAFFDISADTLDRRLKDEGYANFAEYRKKHMQAGLASLRRAQWVKGVEEMDRVMLIWLGKQMLGQKEPHLLQGDPNQPLVTKITHEIID